MGRGMWRGPTGRYCRNRARQAFNNEWRKAHPKNEPSGCLTSCLMVAGLIVFAAVLIFS